MRAPSFRVASVDTETEEPSSERTGSIFTRTEGSELELGSGRIDRLQQKNTRENLLVPKRRFSEKVVFRFNLGLGLDGGKNSGGPLLSGSRLDSSTYEQLRIYSFGDAAIGTHDLGFTGLNTYLAGHFQSNRNSSERSWALPSIYDANFTQPLIRSAYGEVDQLFSHPLLKPLHLRAGRSYQYGISPLHFDGITVGYDTPTIKLSFFGGQRVNLYLLDSGTLEDESTTSGASVRIDLFEWRRWPLVFFANNVNLDGQKHYRAGIALRWNQDMLLSSSLRYIDSDIASSNFSLRARISDVTTVNLALSNRTRSDWSYGMLQVRTPDNFDDSRRYLDLGSVLPKTTISARYGTVLLRNLDILLRASGAIDRRDKDEDLASSFRASYVEGGGGIEVHARRSLRLGLAASARRYFLQDITTMNGISDIADPLPASTGSIGVSSFLEGGTNFVYSPGAREFSASAEFYGRRYEYQSPFLDSKQQDWRSGARFSLEGWTFNQVRIKTEYDLSFGDITFAPELDGLKSLRVLMEGSF